MCKVTSQTLFDCQCRKLGVVDVEDLSGEELHAPDSFLVMLNGLILGKHTKPQASHDN